MKIHLAGSENAFTDRHWVPQPKTNVFLSYYNKAATKAIVEGTRPEPRGTLTIDSGAHSFFACLRLSASNRYTSMKMPDPKEYFKTYLDWLLSHERRWDYFVELDLQEIVGLSQVKEWRREYERAGIAKRAIWVYHNCDPWSEFEYIANESPSRYIGTEGVRRGRPLLPFAKMIRYAYDHSCRIHGFAMIKNRYLNSFPFYSIDSSSWAITSRFGVLPRFNEQRGLVQYIPLYHHEMYRRLQLPERLNATHGKMTDEAPLYWLQRGEEAFRRLERHLTEMWEARGIKWTEKMNEPA